MYSFVHFSRCGWMPCWAGSTPEVFFEKERWAYFIPEATEDARTVFWNTLAYARLKRENALIIREKIV